MGLLNVNIIESQLQDLLEIARDDCSVSLVF